MASVAVLWVLALGGPMDAPECAEPPRRRACFYWSHIDACGCAKLAAPSRAALDYDRFMKACRQWRERNPQVNVIAPEASPQARPQPQSSPKAATKPGARR